ncbi:MAG: hypothetical protein TUN42_05820 [Dehalogenimonas sp.]
MEQTQNSPAVEQSAAEEARLQLIRLTSEYYSLRTQCNNLAPDQNSQGNARDARNVLILDRLEEITQETKQLLPSVYPQLDIKVKTAVRSRRPRQNAEK